jgi:hypothetical protein
MMDVHQKYLEGGEIIYAPKVDSLVFRNGKGRTQLWFWLLESPNVRSVDIYWNAYADSLIVPVTPSAGLDSMAVYIPLKEERTYTFYVRTTDIFGNHSLSEMGSATSYGSIYESTLTNRGVKNAETAGSITTVQWYGIADDYIYSEIRYTGVNSEVQIARTLPNEESTSVSDAKAGSTWAHRSLYVPTNSIDTFYLEWEPITPTIAPAKFDKSSWSIIAFSDERADDGGGVTMIINNSLDDFWHSQWGPDEPLPHWAIIDMGAPKTIVKIDTYRRNNTKTVEYYVCNELPADLNLDAWTKIAGGSSWSDNKLTLNATADVPVRYLLIYLPDSENPPYTTIREIDVFGYE